jgi:SAM-dependent methyltransferase
MSEIPREFTPEWYDRRYFAAERGQGKKFRRSDGNVEEWSYFNPKGVWEGCKPIAEAWKKVFNPRNMLDAGAGRGPFIVAAREAGIEAEGFDFSEWAVGEGRVEGCKPEWLRLHDATKPWPYEDESFDLVVCLDTLEHIYLDDIPFVIREIYRVARKWVFLQIAIVGGGSGYTRHEKGYILKRGEPVPVELEGNVVAGHVTVTDAETWREWLDDPDFIERRDLVNYFYSLVRPEVVVNWRQNLVTVMERF